MRVPLALLLIVGITLVPPAEAGLAGRAAVSRATLTLGGKVCDLIEVPAAAPVGTGSCPGVRPGAVVLTPNLCTLNFLFLGGDGRAYMGTAGHCALGKGPTGEDVGEQSWNPGVGPVARDGAGQRIGEFAYAVLQSPKDFALVRLEKGVEASPKACHFGGPTGINNDVSAAPMVLEYYGNGLGVGTVLPARSAIALGTPDLDHVFASGAAIPGDSGSGVMDSSGRALGVLVTLGLHATTIGTGGVDAGIVGITRLGPQVERAEQVIGTSLRLQTAPQM